MVGAQPWGGKRVKRERLKIQGRMIEKQRKRKGQERSWDSWGKHGTSGSQESNMEQIPGRFLAASPYLLRVLPRWAHHCLSSKQSLGRKQSPLLGEVLYSLWAVGSLQFSGLREKMRQRGKEVHSFNKRIPHPSWDLPTSSLSSLLFSALLAFLIPQLRFPFFFGNTVLYRRHF